MVVGSNAALKQSVGQRWRPQRTEGSPPMNQVTTWVRALWEPRPRGDEEVDKAQARIEGRIAPRAALPQTMRRSG